MRRRKLKFPNIVVITSEARLLGGAQNKIFETPSRVRGRSPPTLEKFRNFRVKFQVKFDILKR